MSTTIEITELSTSYAGRQVLSGVDFTARPGRVTGLLGANGSGKTTTLRILLGLARCDDGAATFDRRSFAERCATGARTGVLLEDAGLHPGLTPRTHLRIAAAARGLPATTIAPLLEEVALSEAATRKVRQMSQGMRRRLGLALALLGDPDVLILDEPANGLDPEGMIWLRGLIRARAEAGTTVLITSHVLAELELVVDDVIVIDAGRVAARAHADELAAHGGLEAFYLGARAA